MENQGETVPGDDSVQCIHYWIIDAANLGVCKKCGQVKQFSGTWSAASSQKAWGRNSTKAQNDPQETKS